MMPKIAFAGKIGTGKSTLADYLVDVWGYDVFSFAHNLRVALMDMGVNPDDLYYKPTKPWVRWLLQRYGSEERAKDRQVWVNRLLADVEDAESERPVIDDLRYTNEATALHLLGYKLVKLVTIGETYRDAHASENDLNSWGDWDLVIEAAPGDLDAMYKQMDDYLWRCLDEGN